MEDKDKFIDQLLDSALARGREAVPKPGLEARIIEGARAATGKSPRGKGLWIFPKNRWIALAAAGAAVAIIATVRIAVLQHNAATPTPQISRGVPSHSLSERSAKNSEAASRSGALALVVNPKPMPAIKSTQGRRSKTSHWPAQFPTPAPLSAEQKALVQYVRNTPPQVLATPILGNGISGWHVQIEPVKISPVTLAPLEFDTSREETQ